MSTISASASAQALASRGVAYASQIASAAVRHDLDPRLLAAVAAQETGGPGSNAGRNVVGDGGHGHGIFQIDDRFHQFARGTAALEPAANADYAAGMLQQLLQMYGGNTHKALSAYNAGDPNARGTVTTWQDGSHLDYADSVMRHYAALGASEPLLDSMLAERQSETLQVGALSLFAAHQPIPIPQMSPQSPHSYRALAGLDGAGHGKHDADYASIVDGDDRFGV